jgi:hypothetical protein
MHRIIYVSKATTDLSEKDIRDITDISITRNAKLKLSGFLTYKNHEFLQYLEGSQSSIEEIWVSIQRDPRHNILQSWQYESNGPRYFPDWHMRYLKAENTEDRVFDILSRTFEALLPPLKPEITRILEGLLHEVAERKGS